MKKLECEVCGSGELIKQDGVFVCQYCGCKYTLEEARKLMIDISGSTVKIDNSAKLANLYVLARRALQQDNAEDAERYYSEILLEDPNSWEAEFYRVYIHATHLKNNYYDEQIAAVESVANCLDYVSQLLLDHIAEEEQTEAYTRFILSAFEVETKMIDKSIKHKNNYNNYSSEKVVIASVDTICLIGDYAEKRFNDIWLACKLYIESMNKIIDYQSDKCFIKLKNKLESSTSQYTKEYWRTHTKQKKDLEDKKEELNEQKKKIDRIIESQTDSLKVYSERISSIDAHNKINKAYGSEEDEYNKYLTYIEDQNRELKALGFFQGKKKEAIEKEIADLRSRLNVLIGKIREKTRNSQTECNRLISIYSKKNEEISFLISWAEEVLKIE